MTQNLYLQNNKIFGNIDNQTVDNMNKQIIDNLDEISKKMFANNQTIKDLVTPKNIKFKSSSEWKQIYEEISKIYDLNDFSEKSIELLTSYAQKIADKLIEEKISPSTKLSDCSLFAPRLASKFNNENKFRLANLIAELMYIKTGRCKEVLHGKIQYSRLISRLTREYCEQYTKELMITYNHKMNRILEHNRKNWCELKNRPVSKFLTEPKAMPVEIAKLEDLKPFFQYIESDGNVVINNTDKEPCMIFCKGALYQDGRMDLCKQVVGNLWIGELMRSLLTNHSIKHFLLGNNIIGVEGGKAIGEFLANPNRVPKIQTWYLAGNDLNGEAIRYIVDQLCKDVDMKYLWLKRNPLKIEGLVEIKNLLKSHQNIKTLDLHNTAMFDEGMKFLCEGLKENRSLRHLYLGANGITSKGVEYFVNYLEHLKSNKLKGITSLWFDMNYLDDNGVIMLFDSLKDYPFIKRLIVGSNGLTEKSMKSMYTAFKDHQGLKVLDLGMYKSTGDIGMTPNNIGDGGIEHINLLIRDNRSIQFLDIMMNGISAEGIKILSDQVKTSTTLLFLNYEQYGVGVDQNIRIAIDQQLKQNRIRFFGDDNDIMTRIRRLKHGDSIRYIDSVYRNGMK